MDESYPSANFTERPSDNAKGENSQGVQMKYIYIYEDH